MTTGAQLREERENAGIRANAIAECLDRDEAVVHRLEQADSIPPERVKAYRRALGALTKQRRAARNDLLKELATK